MSNHDAGIKKVEDSMKAAKAELEGNRTAAGKDDTFAICNIDMHKGDKQLEVTAGEGKEYVIQTLEGEQNKNYVEVKAKGESKPSKNSKDEQRN